MKKTIFKNLMAILSMQILIACSGEGFSTVNPGGYIPDKEQQIPACEIDPVVYELSTNIYEFEVSDSSGGNFGFNLGGFLSRLSLNFSAQSGQMQLHMAVVDALSQNPLSDANGVGPWKSSGFGGSIDFGHYGVGASYASTTPIGKMTLAGLHDGFNQTVRNLAAFEIPWQTRVVAVEKDGSLFVGVGAVAGLKVGDQFAIFNVVNEWAGVPCASAVVSQKKSQVPVAIATVMDSGLSLDGSSAVLTVTKFNANEVIQPGALVFISALKGKGRSLKLPMRVRPVQSASLQLVNGQSVSLADIAEQQINTVVTGSGFFIHR